MPVPGRAAAGNPDLGKVAYFCRLAALQAGVAAMATMPADAQAEAGAALGGLMTKTEQDREAYGVRKEEEASDLAAMESYALSVFAAAERSYRGGLASKVTIQQYQAAAAFLDAVQRLGGGSGNPKLRDMVLWAKKAATDIFRALKAGQVPTPPASAGAWRRVGFREQPRCGQARRVPRCGAG